MRWFFRSPILLGMHKYRQSSIMLKTEQKQSFEENGFLVVEGVMPLDLLADIQTEARQLAQTDGDKVGRVWHERALFRREAFRRVLDVSTLIEAEEDLIGPDVQLLALDLLLTRAGGGGIGWHRDVHFVCNKTLSINTAIYLQDMTEETGPLRVIPGSHRREVEAPSQGSPQEEVLVPVRAGDAVFFDAGLLHSGSPNRSSDLRMGLFAYFGRYWIKRMDNYFTQPLPAELLYTSDPMKRQLLGLGLRPDVASYHGDDESYNRRGEAGIDFA